MLISIDARLLDRDVIGVNRVEHVASVAHPTEKKKKKKKMMMILSHLLLLVLCAGRPLLSLLES